jgi:hypothetical protein
MDDLLDEDVVSAAASVLGTRLDGPALDGPALDGMGVLVGSGRSAVLRCRRADSGDTVIVKAYPSSARGKEAFAREAAGLAFSGPAGTGPALIGVDPAFPLMVMEDLGSAPSLADLLLGPPSARAENALRDWAAVCGRLAAWSAGRAGEYLRLRSGYGLAAAAPGPESVQSGLAAVQFSTCWCVLRLPSSLAASLEDTYRSLVCPAFPDLADDSVWEAGMRRATVVWTLHAMSYLLDRAIESDRSMNPDVVGAPTARALLRYRWQTLRDLLVAPTELSARVGDEFPALTEAMSGLLAATVHWQVPPLPFYPALA